MNRNRIITIALFALAIAYWAYNRYGTNFKEDAPSGIQFHRGTWAEAIQLAKDQDKIIFLDIYATWCGPCKKMKTNTFSNQEVGKLFNERFINVSLDGEEDEGATLAKEYQVNAYPTLLFIDANGKVIGGTKGYYSPKQLLELVQQVK